MTSMDDKRLAEIEARENAATKGPWRWEINRRHRDVQLCGGFPSGHFDKTIMSFSRCGMQGATPKFWYWPADKAWCDEPKSAFELAEPVKGREHHADWFATINHPDARFIEESRIDIPDLIAEVRRLKEVNAEMLAALKVWLDFDNQEIKTAIAKTEKRS